MKFLKRLFAKSGERCDLCDKRLYTSKWGVKYHLDRWGVGYCHSIHVIRSEMGRKIIKETLDAENRRRNKI